MARTMKLRDSNKTSHPGLAQLRNIHNEVPPPRRSHAEVEAERAEKAAAATAKKQKEEEDLQRVAEFEAQVKQRTSSAAATANDVRTYAEVVRSGSCPTTPTHNNGQ